MTLLNLIVILAIVGVILWLINRYIPMASSIKNILNVAVIIFVIVWLLGVFGILGPLNTVHLGS